jgi:glycosyltransferase involved in cell wall biosynthesis
MQNMNSLAIVVPVFNEEASLEQVLAQLLAVRGTQSWDIIVVDDGSRDGSAAILERFSAQLRILRHPSNRGYGAALKTGILATQAENVLLFDSDGQHVADDIPAMIRELGAHECVFGVRPAAAGAPAGRRPGKWLLRKVCNFLALQKIPDINCGFRAGRRRIFMRMLDLLPDGFSFTTTSLMYVIKSRFSYTFLPVQCRNRLGKSSVNIVTDGVKTLLLALRLSMLFDPLRVFGYPAVALIAAGVVYQAYIFYRTGLHIEGGAILSILAGIILFHFGLLGDQIASLRKEISSHYSLDWEERARREKEGAAPE